MYYADWDAFLADQVETRINLDASESGYVSEEARIPRRDPKATRHPRRTSYGAHPDIRNMVSNEIARGRRTWSLNKPEFGNAIAQVSEDIIDHQIELFLNSTKKNMEICVGTKQIDPQLVIPDAKGESSQRKSKSEAGSSLVDIVASKIALQLGAGRESDLAKLDTIKGHPALKRVLYQSGRTPFSALMEVMPTLDTGDGVKRPVMGTTEAELDNLIMLNEKYMRARMSLDDDTVLDRRYLAKDLFLSREERQVLFGRSHWKDWMIGLGRDGNNAFGEATTTGDSMEHYTLQRADAESLPGISTLYHKRKDRLNVRTLKSFKENFAAMTSNMFEGFDWSNVFIAGGIILAALTATTDDEINAAKSSDLDVYLYALSAEDATAKLSKLEEAYKKGLPEEDGVKMGYAVSRSSKTVTFLPAKYPHRRLQVILKLCSSPMAVLSNFDLDQVGVGFDGEEVWMLPRAVRAMWTGFTTFTMDLVHGSYLNQRRATQDERVWKYGRRGYGLRFLPSYVNAVKMKVKEVDKLYDISWYEIQEEDEDEVNYDDDYYGSDIDDEKKIPLPPPKTADAENECSAIEMIMERERLAMDWYLACNTFGRFRHQDAHLFKGKFEPAVPTEPRVMLCKMTGAPEVALRSSMASFGLFARHIALHEHQQLGLVNVKTQADGMFDASYDEDMEGYGEEPPNVHFDETFTLDAYRNCVKAFSEADTNMLRYILESLGFPLQETQPIEKLDSDKRIAPRVPLERIAVRDTVAEAWACLPTRVVLLPRKFYNYAKKYMPEGTFSPVFDFDAAGEAAKKQLQAKIDDHLPTGVYLYWRHQATWQLVNRRRDEVTELLHVFSRVARFPYMRMEDRLQNFAKLTTRRLVRPTMREEVSALRRWLKEPVGKSSPISKKSSWGTELNASYEVLKRRLEMSVDEAIRLLGTDESRDIYDGLFKNERKLRLTLRRGTKRKADRDEE